jgi:hypothetical protein
MKNAPRARELSTLTRRRKIRTARYKLVLYLLELQKSELYDLSTR